MLRNILSERYLRRIVRDSVAKVLNEATDGRFSVDELNNIPYFRDREKYCEKHLGENIGRGSSRVVFQIDDNKVLKLAWNECNRSLFLSCW